MATPYITPDILRNAPTGISWDTLPDFGADPQRVDAEIMRICWRASTWMDQYCNQPLRATLNVENFNVPEYRAQFDSTGNMRVLMSRWPVTDIPLVQYAPSMVPNPTWATVPAGAYYIENELTHGGGISVESAAGPNAIIINPGYIFGGRKATRLAVTYVNGWAHAGIIASAAEGDTSVSVDDVTGALNGGYPRGLWINDGSNTEYVSSVSTSGVSGDGTITLTGSGSGGGLLYAHEGTPAAPIIISALPFDVQQAAILHATYQALVRGATAITTQNMPGAVTNVNSSNAGLLQDAKDILTPFRRVV